MSEEIDSSPIIFDLYYQIRQIITPNQNSNYLFIESILIGLLISIYQYNIIYPSLVISICIITSFVSTSISNYSFVQSDKTHLEEKTLTISVKRLIFISSISLTPYIILYLVTSIYNILLVLAVIIYSFSLYWRSKKYLSEPKFYVNIHGDISTDWHKASIYLEKGLEQLQEKNMIRSFYWFKKSQKKYEYILENEERISLKEGAEALSQAALFYSELTFVDKIKYKLYYQKGNKRIKQANQFFSTRFCDSCGKRKKTKDVSMFKDGNIYCKFCQINDKNKKYKSSRNKKNKRKTKENKMTQKEARRILSVPEPITEQKVKSSFRNKVKEVHPDVGGSEDEFKKAQKARDILMNKVSK